MIKLTRLIISKIETLTGLPIKRAVKFALVGSSGVLVNMGFFFIFNEIIRLAYQISSIIAIEIAIINNFIWNAYWTWKDRKTANVKEKRIRFLKYHLITGASSLMNYGILILLVEAAHMNKYIANLIGILIAMGFNFILNHKWTFKKTNP